MAFYSLICTFAQTTKTDDMRRLIPLLMLCVIALSAQAKGWDEQQYKQIEKSIRVPQFTDKEYVITKFGAKTDGTAAKNQKAIQKAIDKCSAKGGGRVVVPAGQKFLTAAIQLKSGVNLVVEEGAVLEFSFEPELYPIVPTRWEGLDCWNLSPLMFTPIRQRTSPSRVKEPSTVVEAWKRGGLGSATNVLVTKTECRLPSGMRTVVLVC